MSTQPDDHIFDLIAAGIEAHFLRQRFARLSFTQFARHVLGVRLWKRQRELRQLIDMGCRRVAGKWGHGSGKTLAGAVAVCRWLACDGPGTVVVASAPSYHNARVASLCLLCTSSFGNVSAPITMAMCRSSRPR